MSSFVLLLDAHSLSCDSSGLDKSLYIAPAKSVLYGPFDLTQGSAPAPPTFLALDMLIVSFSLAL